MVDRYNADYSWLEKEIWKISLDTKRVLLQLSPNDVLSDSVRLFAWHVAKWGNIWYYDMFPAAAQALWNLRTKISVFSGKDFKSANPEDVCYLCSELVGSMCKNGIRSRQWSWASKMLHWLMPDCFPIYDKVVLNGLDIESERETAYREIIGWEYECAKHLESELNSAVGDVEPRKLLRAIDKYIWYSKKDKVGDKRAV